MKIIKISVISQRDDGYNMTKSLYALCARNIARGGKFIDFIRIIDFRTDSRLKEKKRTKLMSESIKHFLNTAYGITCIRIVLKRKPNSLSIRLFEIQPVKTTNRVENS